MLVLEGLEEFWSRVGGEVVDWRAGVVLRDNERFDGYAPVVDAWRWEFII